MYHWHSYSSFVIVSMVLDLVFFKAKLIVFPKIEILIVNRSLWICITTKSNYPECIGNNWWNKSHGERSKNSKIFVKLTTKIDNTVKNWYGKKVSLNFLLNKNETKIKFMLCVLIWIFNEELLKYIKITKLKWDGNVFKKRLDSVNLNRKSKAIELY